MPTEKKSGTEGRCPSCGRQSLEQRLIRDEFDYGPEDERIRVVAEAVPVLVCTACEEVFYGPEAEQAHHRAICKALRLLTPEEIKAVRERLGMNQGEFARLTGIGVATLSRWERGRLMQTRAMDLKLRVLDAVPDAVRVLKGLADRPVTPPSRKVTPTILARRARFQFYPAGAAADRAEPRKGVSAAAVAEESVRE